MMPAFQNITHQMLEAQREQQLPWLKTQNAFNTITTSVLPLEMPHSLSTALEPLSTSQTL